MEASNIKAMRDALLMVKKLFDGRIMFQPAIREAHKAVNAALAEPPRNCDVGTPEEQFKRFNMFCFPIKCRECKLYTEEDLHDCIFRWLQLPYEKGDAK